MKKFYVKCTLILGMLMVPFVLSASVTADLVLTGYLVDPPTQLSVEIVQTSEQASLQMDLSEQYQNRYEVGNLHSYTTNHATYYLEVSSLNQFNLVQEQGGSIFEVGYTLYIYGQGNGQYSSGDTGGVFSSTNPAPNSDQVYGLEVETTVAAEHHPAGLYTDTLTFTIGAL